MEKREILTVNREKIKTPYQSGDLSKFPISLDDSIDLYEVANNSITVLINQLDIGGDSINVGETDSFPNSGVIRINDEMIYYRKKNDNTFFNLIREFNGSRQMRHSPGVIVLGCVSSLHHNSVRDSILKSQQKIGLVSDNPDIKGTLTSRVKFLDQKWFTPIAKFFAKPVQGIAPLKVNFRNWSLGTPFIKAVWDFGDLTSSSSEFHTVHTYETPGFYTVTLTIQSSDGRSSSFSKKDYIKVLSIDNVFSVLAYSRDSETKKKLKLNDKGRPLYDNRIPLEVEFVDQTLGQIFIREWNFDDGNIIEKNSNPYDHTIKHVYNKPGIYWPELKVTDFSGNVGFYRFSQPIIVGLDFKNITKQELILGNINIKQNSLERPEISKKQEIQNSILDLDNSLITFS